MSSSLRVAATLALVACGTPGPQKPEPDPCGLPPGVNLPDLDPRAANVLTRRALACNDHRYGRISDEAYRKITAALDAELAGKPIAIAKRKKNPEPDGRLIDWATSVIDVSSQYSDSGWSASRVLGPPDVYPAYGDQEKAWASQGADDKEEYIEVAFERAGSISAVEVYETFNPGAIDRVELITARGRRIDVPILNTAIAPSTAARRVFEVRCTKEPIASVRVHLDSVNVAGWNEIDAIGVVPCTP